MNSTKGAHKLQKRNSRVEHEGLEENDLGWSTADPLRYSFVTLINKKSTIVQAPESGHAGRSRVVRSKPTSGKIKSSGVHKQVNVYMIK